MAKPIYMTDTDIDSVMAELRSIVGKKCYGGIDIQYKKNLARDNRSAAIYFTTSAWIKMTSLVARFKTEVQWHGLVKRVSEAEFRVYDIIVPPHEVSGTTVTSDYAKYTEWINALDDDTFDDMHFHGHSHVNMGVIPSAVDNKYRTDVVTQLPKPMPGGDVFYIFMIMNKDHAMSAEIYDLTYNALYETGDIIFDVDMDIDLDGFVNNAKKVAVAATPAAPAYNYPYAGYGGSNNYSGKTNTGSAKQPEQPTSVTPVKNGTPAKQQAKGVEKGSQKKKCSNCAFYDYCKLHCSCIEVCDDYTPYYEFEDDAYGSGYGY